MVLKFEVAPEDPPFVHLAAPLMERTADSFNAWLIHAVVNGASPQNVAKAAGMAFATQLAAMIPYTAVAGKEEVFLDSLLSFMRAMILQQRAVQESAEATKQ